VIKNEGPFHAVNDEVTMMTKRTVGTILGLLILAVGVSGMPGGGQESPLQFTPPAAAARIPVELWESLAFVRCRVNGSEPAWFVFDTGASINVLDLDFAAKLNLDLSDKQKHPRSGQEIIKVHGLKFSLPGVELTGQTATVINLADIALFAGHPTAGVFGYEWLRQAVAEIDYAGRTIALFDPQAYAFPSGGEKLALAVVGNWPVIMVRLEQSGLPPVENRIILDSGSLTAVSLMTGSLARDTVELPVSAGITGVGAGNSRAGRLEAVTVGKWTFKNVPAVFPAAGTAEPPDYLTKAVASSGIGLIGGQLMCRIKLVFDYPGQTLWMEPNPGWDRPFEWDGSGAVVMSADLTFQSFRVLGVIKGSPAAEAGLAAGDVITAVNGRPAGEFTLPQFRGMLKRDGDRITLEVRRGKEIRKVTFVLRTLI
jgi:hypothetical protein